MTKQKHLKQLIRSRMERTGESYTAARAHIVGAAGPAPGLGDPRVVQAHGRHGQCVVFSPDGDWVISGGQDRMIRFHDAATMAPGPVLEGHEKIVNSIGLTTDGRRLVSGSSDRRVRIWDAEQGWKGQELGRHRDAVTALSIHPAGGTVVTAGHDARVKLWDLGSLGMIAEIVGPLGRVAALVHTADGTTTAESGLGGEVVLRAAADLGEIGRIDTGAPGVLGLAMSPDGALLACACADGALQLWDAPAGELVRRIDVAGMAQAVAISDDGAVVAGTWDRHVGMWSADRDGPVDTFDVGIKGVYALAFAPGGRRLAQTGADGKVRVWDVRP